MNKYASTLLALALGATFAQAGTAPVSSSKNPKAPVVAPEPECPNILNYSYLEAGWIRLDLDNGPTLNGGFVDVSYQLAPHFFGEVGSTLMWGDDFDTREVTAGVGGYLPLCDRFHLVGRTGWAYQDVTSGGGDEHQWYISPGFRAMLTCNLELYGKAYCNIAESDTVWSYGGGLVWHFDQRYALSTGVAGSEDGWSLQAAVRIGF